MSTPAAGKPLWTPLLEEFGWGDLKDHYSPCDDEEHDDDDENECSTCRGENQVRWGSFYGDSDGECTKCGLETYTNDRLFEDMYICLVCYLKAHKERCGCGLFRAAEQAAGI